MNAPFSQDGRLGKFHTEPKDSKKNIQLALLRFSGADLLNDLFEYRVEALSTNPDIDFNDLLGTHGRVEIIARKGESIWFDGIITRIVWAGAGENGHRYDLELRPWLWLAGKRRDQRIFHNMTAPEIITQVFDEYSGLGNPHLQNKLTRSYPVLEYTVQYRESDMDFARRLMERFGINFIFTHSDSGHTLVMLDDIDEHPEIPHGDRPYYGVDGHHQADEEHFWEFLPERNITTGSIRLTDYNFKHPTKMMEVDFDGHAPHDHGDIEAYDYPGDYLDAGDGAQRVAPLRTEQERTQDQRVSAVGDVVSLKAGERVRLTGDHLASVQKDPYVCLSATHSYVSDSYGSGGKTSDSYSYQGRYVLQSVTSPLVPVRKTRVPVIHGPQTAMVVSGDGNKATEIDCDQYGRILVRFHWDLKNAYSMRCRVSQNWASKGWGGMVIPRIGMEVVVEFLEGDPDKPLVTGCVYNGRNDPPYPLPANKTKSVFKTDTHQGSGFNELTFDDDKDNELIYMHGQKDQQIEILNDRSKSIGRDESNTIGRDLTQSVGQDETMSVGRDQRETVGRDVVYQVGQNQQESYGKDHVHFVGNVHKQDIFADHLVQVGRNFEGTVLGKYKLDVTGSITNNTGTHTLMAFQKFVIKGPGGKITLDASGITLEAAMINLKGMVKMGGMGSAQVPTLQGAANDALPLVEECIKQKGEE
jgi:type VI secretion system secreted protein VgrG